MQNLPLSNSTYSVFTLVLFGCFSECVFREAERAAARWPEGGLMVSYALTQWWTLPLQRQLIIVADSFTLVQNDSLNDRLCILNRQTDNRDTLLEDMRAAKHQQCHDSLRSRLIILYVQVGIHRLIDSILNRIVLLPIRCTFWQGTCKNCFQHTSAPIQHNCI